MVSDHEYFRSLQPFSIRPTSISSESFHQRIFALVRGNSGFRRRYWRTTRRFKTRPRQYAFHALLSRSEVTGVLTRKLASMHIGWNQVNRVLPFCGDWSSRKSFLKVVSKLVAITPGMPQWTWLNRWTNGQLDATSVLSRAFLAPKR
jgi:hypothetical protein